MSNYWDTLKSSEQLGHHLGVYSFGCDILERMWTEPPSDVERCCDPHASLGEQFTWRRNYLVVIV